MSNPIRRLYRPEMKLLLRDLEHGPANIHDLCAAVGIGLSAMYRYLKLARAAGRVRICGYESARGGRPVYDLVRNVQQRRDVPRPEPLTGTQQKRQWRAKQKAKNETRV
jgi:hypothetical protein